MARKVISGAVAWVLISLGSLALLPAAAGAATTTPLSLNQSAAFAILGHSCGGIQEQVYATGFAANGYPNGDVYLQTRCGGSGRGGGYKSTTYSAWASVAWDWFGDTRSSAPLTGASEGSTTFSAEDAHGDRIYNVGTAAYLETTSPPVVTPVAPTGVTAVVSAIESGEQLIVRFQVSWTPAPETAGLITSSTVTATPVGSSAPVLTTTVTGPGSSALLAPLAPSTTYRITVTNTDAEGTSQESAPIEATSPGEEGEAPNEEPEPPEFGRCVKVPGEKEGTVTYYSGGYTSAGCLVASTTHTGKYEWSRGVVKGSFTTAIKPGTVATLETTGKAKVTCTGESASGTITGPKALGMTIRFSGCESAGAKCTTGGRAEGELQSSALEGALVIERITVSKEGKETPHVALDLYPAGRSGPFVAYTCAGAAPTTLSGSLLAPIVSGKMLAAAPVKFTATAGRQKPEEYEGGGPEFLTNSLFEETGLTLALTQTGEEAVEVNTVV